MPPCSPSPYGGVTVALATRHGKEKVIARPLRRGLGAELLHVPEVDTDALGTFCGTVPRQGGALQACVAKAEAALAHGGTDFALASEGSFGPHPHLPFLAAGVECMVFLDLRLGLTISEQAVSRHTNFAHRLVAAPLARASDPDLQTWLQRVGFPRHGLMARPHHGGAEGEVVKGLTSWEDLREAIEGAAARSADGLALVETDMRAHLNPTRMASIRALAFLLVRRLARSCPACQSPGWGVVDQRDGLPCDWCGLPTSLTRAEVWGCQRCGHQEEAPRPDGLLRADPGHCSWCNP